QAASLPIIHLSLRPLGSVLRSALFAVSDAGCIQRPANHVVTNAWQIFHAASANEHNRVLLQIVADAGNIGSNLDSVRQPYAGYFAQRRIGLLRRLRIYARAHS